MHNKLIREFKSTNAEDQKYLGEIYQRKLAYFARVLRNPDEAILSLEQDLKNKNLPKEIQSSIKDWVAYFRSWKSEASGSRLENLSNTALIGALREQVGASVGDRKISLTDPATVKLMRISGVLYERIFRSPKSPQTQEMLYLLARCERDLSPIQGYSLGDIYLKECILNNPKTAIKITITFNNENKFF